MTAFLSRLTAGRVPLIIGVDLIHAIYFLLVFAHQLVILSNLLGKNVSNSSCRVEALKMESVNHNNFFSCTGQWK